MGALVKLMRGFNIKYTRFLVFYILAAAVAAVLDVLINAQVGTASTAALSGDLDALSRFFVAMAVISAAAIILKPVTELLLKRFGGRADYRLRQGFVKHFLSISFFDLSGKNGGDVLSLYTNDLKREISLVSAELPQLLGNTAAFLASAVYMFIINPWISLVYFVVFPPLAFLQVKISNPIKKKAMVRSEAQSEFNAVVNDSLQNVSTVIAYSLEGVMEERYMERYGKHFKAQVSFVKSLATLVFGGFVASQAPMVILFVYAAYVLEPGQFVVISLLAMSASGWLTMLSQYLAHIQQGLASAKRVSEAASDGHENAAGGELTQTGPAVEFRDVNFSYNGERNVIEGMNLRIEKGSRVAIVGPSGGGKSTVLKLILSLYEPGGGTVSILGNDTAAAPKAALRELIAYVDQESFMFPVSIRDNIADMADDGRLAAACRDAGILDFINTLPQGFESVLTEAGENVSGGQRQRLAVARALYKNAPIAVFDEATSALDPATEAAVLEAFYRSMAGKTVIVTAHRLAAIRDCERIIVIQDGKIAEDGGFEELMAKDGAFAALYKHMERGVSA